MTTTPRLTEIKPLADYRLWLRFADGVEGEVDLSNLADQGVFAVWQEPGAFECVSVGSGGEACWESGVDLCSDALYMKLAGATL